MSRFPRSRAAGGPVSHAELLEASKRGVHRRSGQAELGGRAAGREHDASTGELVDAHCGGGAAPQPVNLRAVGFDQLADLPRRLGRGARDGDDALKEELQPGLPCPFGAHSLKMVVVGVPMLLEEEAEVEQGLLEHILRAEQERDQQAADTTPAIRFGAGRDSWRRCSSPSPRRRRAERRAPPRSRTAADPRAKTACLRSATTVPPPCGCRSTGTGRDRGEQRHAVEPAKCLVRLVQQRLGRRIDPKRRLRRQWRRDERRVPVGTALDDHHPPGSCARRFAHRSHPLLSSDASNG